MCLHHPPVAVGVPAMDAIRLTDADDFAAVIKRHPHVVRVAAGHLHRPVTSSFAGTVLTIAPSTWVQVSLTMIDDPEVRLVAEPTAFLLHRVADGDCVTHTVQVSHAAGRTCWF